MEASNQGGPPPANFSHAAFEQIEYLDNYLKEIQKLVLSSSSYSDLISWKDEYQNAPLRSELKPGEPTPPLILKLEDVKRRLRAVTAKYLIEDPDDNTMARQMKLDHHELLLKRVMFYEKRMLRLQNVLKRATGTEVEENGATVRSLEDKLRACEAELVSKREMFGALHLAKIEQLKVEKDDEALMLRAKISGLETELLLERMSVFEKDVLLLQNDIKLAVANKHSLLRGKSLHDAEISGLLGKLQEAESKIKSLQSLVVEGRAERKREWKDYVARIEKITEELKEKGGIMEMLTDICDSIKNLDLDKLTAVKDDDQAGVQLEPMQAGVTELENERAEMEACSEERVVEQELPSSVNELEKEKNEAESKVKSLQDQYEEYKALREQRWNLCAGEIGYPGSIVQQKAEDKAKSSEHTKLINIDQLQHGAEVCGQIIQQARALQVEIENNKEIGKKFTLTLQFYLNERAELGRLLSR